MHVIRQFAIFITNRPGALAKLTKTLATGKVNILGLSVDEGAHHGVVKMVFDREQAARRVLKRAGFSFVEQDVLAVLLPNRPGALAHLCAKLAAKRVNINYVYGTAGTDCSCESDCDCDGHAGGAFCVLSVDNLELAKKLWRQ